MRSIDTLRHVRLETGHILRTLDTGRTGWQGRTRIGYEFSSPDGGAPIFGSDDFSSSPLHADDADATLRALLGFLTLRPGDTDRDYFKDYTPAQREFAASSECELLAYLYGEDGPGTFADIDVAEGGAS